MKPSEGETAPWVARRLRRGLEVIALVSLLAAALPAAAAPPRLAVAWNDPASGRGQVSLLSTVAPWPFVTSPLEIAANSNLRHAEGLLYAVSYTESTVTVLSTQPWSLLRVNAIPGAAEPMDIAAVNPRRAYVTRRFSTQLLRLDPASGAVQEVLDLAAFEHAQGETLIGMLQLHEGRLFVQVGVYPSPPAPDPRPEAYLAVVDVASEALVDVEPERPGIQAIRLAGTPAKYKMQVYDATRRLFVNASGAFHDDGGLEMVDLDALVSLGLVVAEADENVGADLGAAVLVRPDRGYLVYSTDLLPSSHLHDFSLANGASPIPEYYTVVGYRVPTLLHELSSDSFFLTEGGFTMSGVRVFDAANGAQRSDLLPTSGPPTDIELLCDAGASCGCTSLACPALPAVSIPGLIATSALLAGAAALAHRRIRIAGAATSAQRSSGRRRRRKRDDGRGQRADCGDHVARAPRTHEGGLQGAEELAQRSQRASGRRSGSDRRHELGARAFCRRRDHDGLALEPESS